MLKLVKLTVPYKKSFAPFEFDVRLIQLTSVELSYGKTNQTSLQSHVDLIFTVVKRFQTNAIPQLDQALEKADMGVVLSTIIFRLQISFQLRLFSLELKEVGD